MSADETPVSIDLRTLAVAARERWRSIAIGGAAGVLIAAGVVVFATPRFDGRAMMLIRTETMDPTSLIAGRMGPLGDFLPTLGGGSEEGIATELALLGSRAVLGSVVDSLRLQAVPKSPDRIPPTRIVDSMRLRERFAPATVTLEAGANRLEQGTVWASAPGEVRLLDREDAIDDLDDRLTVKRAAGDAVEILYQARDSTTAAAVPNLLSAVYMARRRTVDRGVNQRRLEFLNAKADSVRDDLRSSADVLASVAQQGAAGANPEIAAQALAEETGRVEARLGELRAAERSLDSLIVAVQSRRADPRVLAGFPDFLRSPALSDLMSQITRTETERTILLGRVPESSPQVRSLTAARDSLVAQVLPIATAFRSSLARQRESAQRDLGALRAQAARLPRSAAAFAKEQAEVGRLAQLNVGMGAQVLEARLAALLEGGDVRLIDEAVVPRRVTFPRPLPTFAAGLAFGLALGAVAAMFGLGAPPSRA